MQTKIQDKDTSISLKSTVRKILFLQGYSHIYNDLDFYNYLPQYKKAFNPALDIARRFIQDNPDQESDLQNYIY